MAVMARVLLVYCGKEACAAGAHASAAGPIVVSSALPTFTVRVHDKAYGPGGLERANQGLELI